MSSRTPNLHRSILTMALLAAMSSPVLAADECGAATKGGKVVCSIETPQVKYEGVEDFEVVIGENVTVTGDLPEPETAVVVYGTGDLKLTGEAGSVIMAAGEAWTAVDIVSQGTVTVDVDTVIGGNGGIAAAADGDINIKANLVAGDVAIMAESFGGNIVVDVTDTAYAGERGAGVAAVAHDGDVHIGANRTFAEADFATGLFGFSENGSVSIDANFVRAAGIGAVGIDATSLTGGDVYVGVNTVSGEGIGSVGILGVAVGENSTVAIDAGYVFRGGDFGVGIGIYAMEGNALLKADEVVSAGEASRAIDIQARYDVGIDVGYVSTLGQSSDAIAAETTGEMNVKVGGIQTFGNDSYGMRLLSSDDINVSADLIDTHGVMSAGLYVQTLTDVNARVGSVYQRDLTNEWFAIGLNAFDGDTNLLVDGEVRSEGGYAITTASLNGGSNIQIAKGASVYGGSVAIDSMTGTGTNIDILGTVLAGTGPSIKVRRNGDTQGNGTGAAKVNIGKTGVLHGFVDLSEGDDVVANGGTFFSKGINAFNGGNDTFANAGTVMLGGTTPLGIDSGDPVDPPPDKPIFAQAPGRIEFAGLERFENGGTVTLANGFTGDVFAVDGTLVAAGGKIVLDLDLKTGSADRIEVGGLSGVNVIDLDIEGRASGLGLSDVLIATSEDGDGKFVLSDDARYRGFVGFDLRAAGNDWVLESDLADEAYLAGAVPAGARDLWRQGTESVWTHLKATDDAPGKNGLWAQYVGGDFDGTSTLSHALGSRELEWHGSHSGVQVGYEVGGDNWRAGVVGSYGDAKMDIGGPERTKLDTVGAGVYAQYGMDDFYLAGMVRGERVDVKSEWGSIGLVTEGDGSTVGFSLEGGYTFDVGQFELQPHVRLSHVDMTLPEQVGANGTVRWEDSAIATSEIGLRFGARDGWKGVRPYASMAYATEFGDADSTTYDLASEIVRVDDEGGRSFGRFAGGVEWSVGRFDVYAEIDTRVGDMEGSSGRAGVRLRF